MPSQGPRYPTAASGASWTNPSRIQSNDGLYAEYPMMPAGTISNPLTGTAFGFTIPIGATIDGVQLEIERHCAAKPNEDIRDYDLYLYYGGSPVGNDKADTGTDWPPADAIATYGGASDLWGLSGTLTAAYVNNSGFGAYLKAKNYNSVYTNTPSIDFYRLTVWYTPAAGQNFRVMFLMLLAVLACGIADGDAWALWVVLIFVAMWVNRKPEQRMEVLHV